MAAATNLSTGPELARALREVAALVEDGEVSIHADTAQAIASELTRLKEAKRARFVAAFKETVDENPEIFEALSK